MGTSPTEGSTTVVGRRPALEVGDAPPATGIGVSMGRYVVLEEVGRGGMGRILRAYDPKLQREVALKEVRRSMLGSEGTTRLVAEARAMAKLSHPNVVGVFDVEELGSGELVIVMEYVAGGTLHAWLKDDGPRAWQDILAQFIAAGRGLAAAHATGLLHRDFKPANVLVSDQGLTKVTDFGLAKGVRSMGPSQTSLSGEAPGESAEHLTEAGVVMGTPRYMAPEQHAGEELMPAADQYAFCVALWTAFSGEAPFSGEKLAAQKRKGPPPWPGTQVPRPIVEAVRRGLSPAPDERWPGMDALLEALADDPARRRNRWLGTAAATGLLGVGTIAWLSWSAGRAQRCSGAAEALEGVWNDARRSEVETAILGTETSYARAVWDRTAAGLDGYAERWTQMHREVCEATTVRGEQSAAVLDLRMACLHRAKVDLDAVVGVLSTADPEVVKTAHDVVARLRPLWRCTDVQGLQSDVEPPSPRDADAVEDARTLLAQARVSVSAGRHAPARAKVEQAKQALVSVDYGPVETELALAEGETLQAEGDYDEAEAALQRALESSARWRQWELMSTTSQNLLYLVGYFQHRADEGLRYATLAEGLATGPRAEARVRNNVATILFGQGKYAEAEAEFRRSLAMDEGALDPDHPDLAKAYSNLAAVLQGQGQYADAEAEFRRAHAIMENALGPDHPDVASARANVAVALHFQGKYTAAEEEFGRALALREAALGPDHPDVAVSHNHVGSALQAQGQHQEAEAAHRRALAIQQATLGLDHPEVALSRNNLAIALDAQGKHGEAEMEYRQALAIRARVLGPEHPEVASAHHNLAIALETQEKYEEAEGEYLRALTVFEEALSPDHPTLATARYNFAGLLFERGRTPEALELTEQAWQQHQRNEIPSHQRANTAFLLARALWHAHDDPEQRQRARKLAEAALADFRDAGAVHKDEATDAKAWLEAHPVP